MQKVAYEMRISDWSSDVCSSDLLADLETGRDVERVLRLPIFFGIGGADIADQVADRGPGRVIAGETARRGDAGQVGQADEDRGIFGLADILLDRDRLEPRGGIEVALDTLHRIAVELQQCLALRSDARRVGKECVSRCRHRWTRYT